MKKHFSFFLILFSSLILVSVAGAHEVRDSTPRIAIISAYQPEQVILLPQVENRKQTKINGITFTAGTLRNKEVLLFLSGISTVNASMSTQIALDHWNVSSIIFSGIAGGVDPSLEIGDVVIPDQWGQYLEMTFARELGNNQWGLEELFEYPYGNFGMMFPRSVDVIAKGRDDIETRFWFPADKELLRIAENAVNGLVLEQCTQDNVCMHDIPRIVIGGNGVSGSAFVDNANFRSYTFETFDAKVLDMESAQVAHVAYANQTPFLAVRSLADLAGGGSNSNEIGIFFALAANNAATVVLEIFEQLP